jgi:hypothetical protein
METGEAVFSRRVSRKYLKRQTDGNPGAVLGSAGREKRQVRA